MALFTIDTEKCARDGLCAADCPLGCIELAGDGLPAPHEKKAAYCIHCGHCMAVCPAGALTLERFARPATPLAELGEKISPEQAERFLVSRRSVRAFKPEPPDRETMARLLDLTEYAPSGHNARPVRWSVAHGRDRVRAVAEAVVAWMRAEAEAETETAAKLHLGGLVRAWDAGTDLICRDAPVLAAALAPEQGITPLADAVIAVSWLELAAHGAGVGACWCGYVHLAALRSAAVREALAVPEGYAVGGALMLGRPARRYRAAPPRAGADVQWL